MAVLLLRVAGEQRATESESSSPLAPSPRSSSPIMVSLETSRLADFLRSKGATVHESLELFGKRDGTGERGAFQATHD